MRRLLLLPLTLVALGVAGCGGDDASTSASTQEAPSAAAPTGKAVAISMEGLKFAPQDVTVKVGTQVTWKNAEDIPHNVTAESGADFASDNFGKDGTYSFKATKAGTVKYVCTIHPGMDGTLTVVE